MGGEPITEINAASKQWLLATRSRRACLTSLNKLKHVLRDEWEAVAKCAVNAASAFYYSCKIRAAYEVREIWNAE